MYMQRCLDLALNGLGHVAPNPLVGAVIVHKDRIIGEGYHQKFGEAHAEVNAIKDALTKNPEALLEESTIYVSLEPCSHTGKTGPCTTAILGHGFKKIVIACEDPFEKVRGSGIKILQSAGMEVVTGILEKEALDINKRFICYHTKKRPYIILKFAESQDHFIAAENPNEENRWISNTFSRKLVHRWRSEEQAVMVGTTTAQMDDPALTLRDWPGKQPLRIVIDRNLRLPKNLKLFDQSAATLIFNEEKDLSDSNLEFLRLNFNKDLMKGICRVLFEKSIQSVMVEGGQKLFQSFIEANLWDEARIFTSKSIIENGVKSPVIKGELISEEQIESDVLRIFRYEK